MRGYSRESHMTGVVVDEAELSVAPPLLLDAVVVEVVVVVVVAAVNVGRADVDGWTAPGGTRGKSPKDLRGKLNK